MITIYNPCSPLWDAEQTILFDTDTIIRISADKEAIEAAALADDKIVGNIEGKTVRKVIVVPGRLVNISAS